MTPRTCYKLNVDASYDSASRTASLGIVLRDEEARVRLAAVTKAEGVASPFYLGYR